LSAAPAELKTTYPEYRQVCLDNPRKWRARHPEYWKQYRRDRLRCANLNRAEADIIDSVQSVIHPVVTNASASAPAAKESSRKPKTLPLFREEFA